MSLVPIANVAQFANVQLACAAEKAAETAAHLGAAEVESADILRGIALVVLLGIGANWVAWRLKLPSIFVLLVFGFAAGASNLLDPDLLFGKLLLPVVSLSVALILFEGGMSLQSSEIPRVWRVVRNLITIGTLVSWFTATWAAVYFLNFDTLVAALLGAILVVSGPTVVGPLLRQIRPIGNVGPILKWEGIIIDPIGVMLAVLVFTGLLATDAQDARTEAVLVVLKTVLFGGALGILGAMVLTSLLERFLIPDHLQSPFTLMLVVSVFTLSNRWQEESGLLAVTLMGILLANQKKVTIRHIVEFKENLRVLIISSLFILLAARVEPRSLITFEDSYTLGGLLAFVGVLIFVARPLAVFLSTLRSDLSAKERWFLCFVAPRGIVAAALASIFALEAAGHGYTEAASIAPVTFVVIFVTVAFYGLLAAPLARKLGLSLENPQGFLIVGGQPWARGMAWELQARGAPVLLADSNRANVLAARMDGVPAYSGDVLSEHAGEELNLTGIGRLLALTPNDEVNTLACMEYSDLFSRVGVFQLPSATGATSERGGRPLWGEEATFDILNRRFAAGATVKSTTLTKEFDYKAYLDHYGDNVVPLFIVTGEGRFDVIVAGSKPPEAGHTVIGMAMEPAVAPVV